MKGFIVSVFNKKKKKSRKLLFGDFREQWQGQSGDGEANAIPREMNGEVKNGRDLDERVPCGIPNSAVSGSQHTFYWTPSTALPPKGGLGTPK